MPCFSAMISLPAKRLPPPPLAAAQPFAAPLSQPAHAGLTAMLLPATLLLAALGTGCSLSASDPAAAAGPPAGTTGAPLPDIIGASHPSSSAASLFGTDRHWVRARLHRAKDGDSLLVYQPNGQPAHLRIAGIDAPERSQPYSKAARKALETLLDGRPLSYRPLKQDQYGRQIVILHSHDGTQRIDVGQAMLEAGLAWYFRRYERDLPAALRLPYQQAENQARQQHRGLWSEAQPLAPWSFRQQRRKGGAPAAQDNKQH